MPSPHQDDQDGRQSISSRRMVRGGAARRLRDGYARLTVVVSAPVEVAAPSASPYPAAPLGNGLVDVWVWYFVARREKPDRHIAMTAST